MSGNTVIRLGQISRKLNVGHNTIIDFLAKKGIKIQNNPNAKLNHDQLDLLSKEFATSESEKIEASTLTIGAKSVEDVSIKSDHKTPRKKNEEEEQVLIKNLGSSDITVKDKPEKITHDTTRLQGIKVMGTLPLKEKEVIKEPKKEEKEKTIPKKIPAAEPEKKDTPVIKVNVGKLQGLKVVDKVELPVEKKKNQPVASSDSQGGNKRKRPRKRIFASKADHSKTKKSPPYRSQKAEPTEKEIQEQVRATLAKLSGGQKKVTGTKYKKEKRKIVLEEEDKKILQEQESLKTLKVTEFISTNGLASLMDIPINDVISTCLTMGMFVSINQRLDAEAITVIADEYGYDVQFTSTHEEDFVEEVEDTDENLVTRAPIVTIMGHVDHGKTSLLDYIRNTKITAQEAGGITQHIGAYSVVTEKNQKIAFLDTPGHEAFTAMRARGAQLTDAAIIVIAADDDVMPQTKEAINHAQVAGVPIIIAINKIDKPGANPEKVKESLSKINILVEDWGGKYQCQEISAKNGQGVDQLLEKVLLESELLELKANPNKSGVGSVIEASLGKGRGYVATFMVQEGTIKIGDVILSGPYYGRIKAMFDSTGTKITQVGPSTPVQVLGLNGAPQAGEKFRVMKTDREAREVATKREQMLREQTIRTKKHITLDEIGRRLAVGSFKELNMIIKGDFDGSIEALSDSLLKLSTPKIRINIIHKGVGQILESDVLLASASDAVIIGFQVRPSGSARKLAENEEIEIRLYSIIYDAIDDVKAAMEGMLEKETEEVITGNIEVREVFKVSKFGTVAGSMVTSGHIDQKSTVRLIRDGIVVYSGEIASLRRFKEDVSEVKSGFECGVSIKNFNDIKVGDTIEVYEIKEVKK